MNADNAENADSAENDSEWLFSDRRRNRSSEGSRLRLPRIAQDVDDIRTVAGVPGVITL
jgi:hypothetical protein